MTKEEEDEANNNNDEYICSDDYNIKEEEDKSQAWGTWEELLLACAVKRHGFTDWISVATEVRSRSSISGFLTSANNCQQKYLDLKRRFLESAAADVNDVATAEDDGGGEKLPWLEQLRSLRVAELRREVQQYDESILSLQIKVKKLEEEEKPDLEEEERRGGERSGNDGSESDHREKTEEESERENRSMNESNSTTSGGKIVGEDDGIGGDEPSQSGDDSVDNKPEPDYKAEEEGSEVSHSAESGRKRRVNHGGFGGGKIRSTASKLQPLICLLDLIRSHPRGSLFERRLRSQETNDYYSLVKQHLDIETIHRNLKQGSYDSSSLSFYRDLKVLFTNAIVFFPSSSSESMAAHELRTIVSEEMSKEIENFRTEADAETSDSSLSKQKSSSALVVCKKRSTVSPSSSSFSQREETLLSEEKENIVTGVRNSRRASKAVSKTGRGGKSNKQETVKTENKKKKKTVSSDKKKSVADFLKRLKNSPQKESKEQSKKETKSKPRELRSNNNNNNNVSKKKAKAETTPSKRAPGRPQKKTVEAAATATASGKRGRESGSTGKDNKQPKKRSRR